MNPAGSINWYWIVLVSVLILLACFFIWVLCHLGVVVEESIEAMDQEVLGVDVSLDHVDFNPVLGILKLSGMTVDNPPGYKTEYLLRAETIQVDVGMRALICSLGHEIFLEKVALANVQVNYEKTWKSSNLNDLLVVLDRNGVPDEPEPSDTTSFLSYVPGASCSGAARSNKTAGTELLAAKPGRVIYDEDKASAEERVTRKHPCRDRVVRFVRSVRECLGIPEGTTTVIKILRVDNINAQFSAEMLGGLGATIAVGDINYNDFSNEVGEASDLPYIIKIILVALVKSILVSAAQDVSAIVSGVASMDKGAMSDPATSKLRGFQAFERHVSRDRIA